MNHKRVSSVGTGFEKKKKHNAKPQMPNTKHSSPCKEFIRELDAHADHAHSETELAAQIRRATASGRANRTTTRLGNIGRDILAIAQKALDALEVRIDGREDAGAAVSIDGVHVARVQRREPVRRHILQLVDDLLERAVVD